MRGNVGLDIDETTQTIINDYQACILRANEIIDAWRPIIQQVIGHGELAVRNIHENNDGSVMASALSWYLYTRYNVETDKELGSNLRTLITTMYCIGRWSSPEQASAKKEMTS